MPVDLVKEKITLDHPIGKQSSQLLLEGDMIVPDSQPDIEDILRCGAQVRLDEEKVNENRVSFVGDLLVKVIYQAKKSRKPIHSIEFSLPIEDFINMEGIEPDTVVTLTPVLDHLECKLVNDRKVSVKAVATITAVAEEEFVGEAVSEVRDQPEMQVLLETGQFDSTVERKKDRFVIKEEVPLSSGKPNIGEIIQTDVLISDKDVRPMDGRVLVRGNLKLSTLYIGDNDDSIIEVMENEIPFSGYIDAKDTLAKMSAWVKLNVENQEIYPKADEDGEDRILDCEITIGADMKVTDSQELELLEDVYCPGKPLQITREMIEYPQRVGQNKNQFAVKETVTLDSTDDPMMQVEKVWANAVLDEITMGNDGLEVQGVITLDILYIGENDEHPISVITQSVPFSQEIECKGASPKDMAMVDLAVEDVSFHMLSDREIEVRVTLGLDTVVTQEQTAEIITDVVFDESGEVPTRSLASAVIYVVKKGDSLWSIAKRYNTTIDDILSLNEIDNPDKLYPGQKLLIIKQVTE